jgi:glycosyltransferase involved in cell wall biosynthesis
LPRRSRSLVARAALTPLSQPLARWDRRAAESAHAYIANSTIVRDRIRWAYGRDAEVISPPTRLRPELTQQPVPGVEPGYFLCVSRLLSYKNVDAVVAAFDIHPGRLVVVGDGPEAERLRGEAPYRVRFLGQVPDDQLRWLYAHCQAVVAASYEDYGLTPVEAAAFGRPAAVLRWGGFLDTVLEDETGVFFDRPTPRSIATALERLERRAWSEVILREAAKQRSPGAFVSRIRALVGRVVGAPLSEDHQEVPAQEPGPQDSRSHRAAGSTDWRRGQQFTRWRRYPTQTPRSNVIPLP